MDTALREEPAFEHDVDSIIDPRGAKRENLPPSLLLAAGSNHETAVKVPDEGRVGAVPKITGTPILNEALL